MRKLVTLVAIFGLAIVAWTGGDALAQGPKGKGPPPPPPPPPGPAFVPLSVSGLRIASHQDLAVEAIDIAVSATRMTYSYRLANKGTAELRLAASIPMPPLEVSSNEDETYRVATANAENPIGLSVTADGKPVNANVILRANALDIDRLAEIKALNLPLVPFGPEIDKALTGLAPDALARLTQLGIISPPSDDQSSPRIADWSLNVIYTWDQMLPPGKTTTVAMAFQPVSGSFELNSDTVGALDDFKEDTCLADQLIRTLKARVSKSSTPVTELLVSIVKPTRWLDNPAPTITVDKPKADAIVALCASNVKASPTRVTATVADDETAEDLRVLLIGVAPR
jgi:Domain of unknown function (DUF4424)